MKRGLIALASAAMLTAALPARAHCDALDGPVVVAARAAIEAGDPAPLLRWVAPGSEAELEAVFRQTLLVRKLGPEARELADRALFESAVRLHRASEGEPYTGLEPAGLDPGPAVSGADQALATGEVDALVELLTDELAIGLRERFQRARAARVHADETLAAGRAWVAAYVDFVHYARRAQEAARGGPHAAAVKPNDHAPHSTH